MGPLILGVEAMNFLENNGFPVLRSLLATSEDEAVSGAAQMGFPVTLKLSSPDVIHKTEADGIRVSLKDADEVRQGFRQIAGAFASGGPERRLDGIMVQRQGSGVEIIVGMISDEQFGPVLMMGLGGIFVEAMKDVSFRLIPIDAFDAKDMMEGLKGYEVLKSPRNGSIDLAAVEGLLLKVSTFITHHLEVREMDLNPVFVSSRGVRICDARIMVR